MVKVVYATLIVLAGLSVSACNHAPNSSDALLSGSEAPVQNTPDTSWKPKWDTSPDKARQAKSALAPTLAFAEQGFRGSPVPQNDRQKQLERKNREIFSESFEDDPECYGITLKLKKPEDADFALQIFEGIYGRTGRWQYVLYQTDTLGERSRGEISGTGAKGLAASVCSTLREVAFAKGGSVE